MALFLCGSSALEVAPAGIAEVGTNEGFGVVGWRFHRQAADVAALHVASFLDEIDKFDGAVTALAKDDVKVIAEKFSEIETFGNGFVFACHVRSPVKVWLYLPNFHRQT